MEINYKNTAISCYIGYIVQAITVNLAPILFIVFQNQFGISFEMIGTLIVINFITQLLVDLACIKYVDKMGFRVSAVLANFFAFFGLVLMAILPNVMSNAYAGLAIATVTYAIGSGLLEVVISPIVAAIPSENKGASSMSLLHSFYCWGQAGVILITTILLSVISYKYWWVLPIIWGLLPLYNTIRFLKVPLMDTEPNGQKIPVKKLFKSGTFICMILIMICAGSSELVMSQWASIFAEKGLHVTKVIGDIAGPFMFAIFMGLGRTLFGAMGSKIKLTNALMFCTALCVLCYVTVVFSPFPYLSLLACALCGFSVSLMWPGTLSLSASKFPLGGVPMFGILALSGDLGCSLGPFMTGKVSTFVSSAIGEDVALKYGIASGIIFPCILLIVLFILKRKKHTII